ncbi:hypothetical protein VP01_1152g5 [Puccinia sorghi]|uniref:Uncharacterized protein n=1 Tax=Puccinia sorghi TaxID=27349 RepID=A0A0L6VRP6_9BASI|nr:hypothetical protein VP01_1152g5 [Puccinia sorghi]
MDFSSQASLEKTCQTKLQNIFPMVCHIAHTIVLSSPSSKYILVNKSMDIKVSKICGIVISCLYLIYYCGIIGYSFRNEFFIQFYLGLPNLPTPKFLYLLYLNRISKKAHAIFVDISNLVRDKLRKLFLNLILSQFILLKKRKTDIEQSQGNKALFSSQMDPQPIPTVVTHSPPANQRSFINNTLPISPHWNIGQKPSNPPFEPFLINYKVVLVAFYPRVFFIYPQIQTSFTFSMFQKIRSFCETQSRVLVMHLESMAYSIDISWVIPLSLIWIDSCYIQASYIFYHCFSSSLRELQIMTEESVIVVNIIHLIQPLRAKFCFISKDAQQFFNILLFRIIFFSCLVSVSVSCSLQHHIGTMVFSYFILSHRSDASRSILPGDLIECSSCLGSSSTSSHVDAVMLSVRIKDILVTSHDKLNVLHAYTPRPRTRARPDRLTSHGTIQQLSEKCLLFNSQMKKIDQYSSIDEDESQLFAFNVSSSCFQEALRAPHHHLRPLASVSRRVQIPVARCWIPRRPLHHPPHYPHYLPPLHYPLPPHSHPLPQHPPAPRQYHFPPPPHHPLPPLRPLHCPRPPPHRIRSRHHLRPRDRHICMVFGGRHRHLCWDGSPCSRMSLRRIIRPLVSTMRAIVHVFFYRFCIYIRLNPTFLLLGSFALVFAIRSGSLKSCSCSSEMLACIKLPSVAHNIPLGSASTGANRLGSATG